MINAAQFIPILLVSATGGFIQRVTGFGFGIFVMLFFPYLIWPHTSATAVSTIVSCMLSTYNAICYRKNIPYKKIIPLVAALVTIPIAVRFSVFVSGDVFKKALGFVLIVLSIYFLFFNNRIKMKPTVKNGIIAGGLGGILSGLFSTGGPPVVLYLMNALTDNVTYFASAQFYFGLTGIYSTIVRLFNGIITSEVVVYSVIGLGGSMIGNFIGKHIFDKLNGQRLKQLIYFGMIISGIVMIV